MDQQNLHDFLEVAHDRYNRNSFISSDPISIPHQFDRKEDIEISAFLIASISWGQRSTIIKNAKNLISIMNEQPYDFIMEENKLESVDLESFKHRTFNSVDLKFFISSLKNIYQNHGGLEAVFSNKFVDVKTSIEGFRNRFLEIDHEKRSEKHIANPANGSAAKRINMFLRWMVRNDQRKVDFGLWNSIPTSALMVPLDVHSGNVARKLGLLKRKQNDWQAVEELTTNLRKFDPLDPVKYDFSLFGLGVFEKF